MSSDVKEVRINILRDRDYISSEDYKMLRSLYKRFKEKDGPRLTRDQKIYLSTEVEDYLDAMITQSGVDEGYISTDELRILRNVIDRLDRSF